MKDELRGQADERYHAKRAWLEKVGIPLASESACFEHGFNAAWERMAPFIARAEAVADRSTHHVHRREESLPCYCKAETDHPIGEER